MSEELLSNDRRQKHLAPPGFEPLTSRFITIRTPDSAICPLFCFAPTDLYYPVLLRSESKRDYSKSKLVKRKISVKRITTFTIIPMNFVQEQLLSNRCLKTRLKISKIASKLAQNLKISTKLILNARNLQITIKNSTIIISQSNISTKTN